MRSPVRTFDWNDAAVSRLRSLWADGQSASQIANQLGQGCTRSAVLGKVHRLKLPARRGAIRPARAPRPRKLAHRRANNAAQRVKARQKDIAKAKPVSVPVAPPDARMIGLMDLTERTCKWPIGDPREPGFGFCGAEKPFDGGPYCALHARVAVKGVAE